MSGKKQITFTITFALAAALIVSSLTAFFLTKYDSNAQFEMLGSICQSLIKKQPEIKQTVMEVLKEHKNQPPARTNDNILLMFGYQKSDLFQSSLKIVSLFIAASFIMGAVLFLVSLCSWRRKEVLRIRALTGYLEKVNTGSQGLLLAVEEDEFAKLQDEIYKTVTTLYQTRDAALESKNSFAENLSNIAHQLKTPITAISLSAQMMKEHPSIKYLEQIKKQLYQLTHLEEALLLLSRIDAGILSMEPVDADVFTVLTLAADNLQELFIQSGVSIDIPETVEISMTVDIDWTMEAIMNLMKNCMEHTPEGKMVHCTYERNPMYTQIRIWDEGNGFAKEDLTHLFERFYRGQNCKDGGIGIGLSLAKEIIEMQNGVVSASNIPDGGACFEIRIYSH